MLNKIGLIGGGFIGGVLTQEIAQRRLAREVGLSDPAPFVNPNDPPERQEVAAKHRINLKPVILFKAQKTIAQSKENKANFHKLSKQLFIVSCNELVDVLVNIYVLFLGPPE